MGEQIQPANRQKSGAVGRSAPLPDFVISVFCTTTAEQTNNSLNNNSPLPYFLAVDGRMAQLLL